MFGPKIFVDALETMLFGRAKEASVLAPSSVAAVREIRGVYHGSGDSGFASGSGVTRE